MIHNQFLVIRLSHLGDIVLTTGVLDYWHREHGWTFHFITSQSMLPILHDQPAVASVISVIQDDKPLVAWIKFCLALRKKYAHLPLIDLHGTLRSRILGALWPKKVIRYSKMDLTRRGFQLTRHERFRKKLAMTNIPQRYSLAMEKVAPPKALLKPKFPVREQDRAWAKKQLDQVRTPVMLALHPYATLPAKEWPREKWLELINRLRHLGIASIVIGQSENPLPSPPKAPSNLSRKGEPIQFIDFTNKTNLAQTCALLEQADALVSGDSGPMHLGTAVNTPVVALFGPTSQEWGFYPSGKDDTVLTLSKPCSPCTLHGRITCTKNFACMRDISVDQVLKKILERVPTPN